VTGLPRYTIAKYIPDVFRNEPRNIGVLLWTPDGTAARFLGEKPDTPGEVDEAAVPKFVSSAHAYKEWVRYWRRELSKVMTGADDPFGRMRDTGPGNFRLADDGYLTLPVPADELPAALDHLFATLVAEATRSVQPMKMIEPARTFAVAARGIDLG
jgi:hypothetical protein